MGLTKYACQSVQSTLQVTTKIILCAQLVMIVAKPALGPMIIIVLLALMERKKTNKAF